MKTFKCPSGQRGSDLGIDGAELVVVWGTEKQNWQCCARHPSRLPFPLRGALPGAFKCALLCECPQGDSK